MCLLFFVLFINFVEIESSEHISFKPDKDMIDIQNTPIQQPNYENKNNIIYKGARYNGNYVIELCTIFFVSIIFICCIVNRHFIKIQHRSPLIKRQSLTVSVTQPSTPESKRQPQIVSVSQPSTPESKRQPQIVSVSQPSTPHPKRRLLLPQPPPPSPQPLLLLPELSIPNKSSVLDVHHINFESIIRRRRRRRRRNSSPMVDLSHP